MMNQSIVALAITLQFSTSAVAESLKAQFDGQDWSATVINSTILSVEGKPVISTSGKFEGDKTSVLSFQFSPDTVTAPAGHFVLKPGLLQKSAASGTFNADLLGGDPMEDGFTFQSGSLEITSYDSASHTLSGTFSGTMANHTKTKQIKVQNGKLEIIIDAQ